MSYLRKLLSLKERASAQVAINMCQDPGFKEVALCLEKPTYGFFTDINKRIITYKMIFDTGFMCIFKCDQEPLMWINIAEAREKHDIESNHDLLKSFVSPKKKVKDWNVAVDEQCQRLTEGLPYSMRYQVQAWMNRVALEYLNYTRHQEKLFEVPRYFWMDFITLGDWKEACQLDKEKLANRMLKDEQLTVFQRYRIACVYCLHVDIHKLWKRLSETEKQVVTGEATTYSFQEKDKLVILWSHYLDQYQDDMAFEVNQRTWLLAAQHATCCGNWVALVSCWRKLNAHTKQKLIIDMALKSVQEWKEIRYYKNWFPNLLFNELHNTCVRPTNLPYDFSELMRFFLSEMNEEQQFLFFKKAFQHHPFSCVLDCFADWLHQDDFLPTINRLWKIIPVYEYSFCLKSLVSKYSADYAEIDCLPSFYLKQNIYYDYQTFLSKLWEETPKKYKQHLFTCEIHLKYKDTSEITDSEALLIKLVKRSPFDRKAEALFKQICNDLPNLKTVMISSVMEGGKENIYLLLILKEKWSTLNWLLEKCSPKKDKSTLKKKFLRSKCGREFSLSQLKDNNEKLVEVLIQWSFELDTEIAQFKYELSRHKDCLGICKSFIYEKKFIEVERIVNFCALSGTAKEELIMTLIQSTCETLLCMHEYEKIDEILDWGTKHAVDKIKELRKYLFSSKGFDLSLLFNDTVWEDS